MKRLREKLYEKYVSDGEMMPFEEYFAREMDYRRRKVSDAVAAVLFVPLAVVLFVLVAAL